MFIHCLFRTLSKYEKMIGSRMPLELRQYSDYNTLKSHKMEFNVGISLKKKILQLRSGE